MEDEKYVEIEIRISTMGTINEIYRNAKNNDFKIIYFNFGPKDEDCFFIKSIDNHIERIKSHLDFDPEKGDEILFKIRKSLKSINYEIINPILEYKISSREYDNNYLNNKIWYIIKSLKNYDEGNNQSYSLNKNDIIKLGKKKYIVDELHILFEKEKETIKDDNCEKNNSIGYISSINKKSKSILNIVIKANQYLINKNNNFISNAPKRCFICQISYSDINNPLICLCDCDNFFHYECLKKHLSDKIIIMENSKKTVTTYRCEKFNCDKCLKPYPLRFRIPEFNKIYKLIDLIFPEETDYICLESLDFPKDNNKIKTIHIAKIIDEEIAIGAGNSNDIIDNDISISSEHALLRYNKNKGKLFLEDKNGKSDTLVLVRGNIKIIEEKTFFQNGNTNISFELKKIKNSKNYSSNLIPDNANNDDNNSK